MFRHLRESEKIHAEEELKLIQLKLPYQLSNDLRTYSSHVFATRVQFLSVD